MPELPEVETTCRGIAPHVLGQALVEVRVRDGRLRWPVSADLGEHLAGETVLDVSRRGKYLLLQTAPGTVLIHLGMSGSLRIVDAHMPPDKHDHVDLVMATGKCLRLRDPRRFGSILWAGKSPLEHRLLASLGPEPLGAEFNGAYLHGSARHRRQAVKTFIMDSRLVVGVGNIYASESLHRSGIHPARAAGRIAKARYERLAFAIREVLQDAIRAGGTTLRDFVSDTGTPGYFSQLLMVYGRTGEPCYGCRSPIRQITLGQRSTYYCPSCQR